MDDKSNLRDELQRRIDAGSDVELKTIAHILLAEVLPAQDRIERELKSVQEQLHLRNSMVELVMCEIHGIYAHLQDTVPLKDQVAIIQQKNRWRDQMNVLLKSLENAIGEGK